MEEIQETTLNKTQNYTRTFTLSCVFAFIFVFFSVGTVSAATLYLSPSSGTYNVDEGFQVSVFVSSTEQQMNTAEGVISFPQDRLEITSLSKSGSIITFLVQDPSFSNNDGIVTFEGVVLPGGFKGRDGKIITLNLKAKTTGTASLSFSDGAVLAHDGIGTDILSDLEGTTFSIEDVEDPPEPEPEPEPDPSVVALPEAPSISSPTHSNSDEWYPDDSPEFEWSLSNDVTAVRLSMSRVKTTPTVLHKPPISERQLEDLTDGVWYFSAQFRNEKGWGEIGRYKLQIDTKPPEYFTITETPREDPTRPRVSFEFDAEDETSGISHYEIWINGERQDNWQNNDEEVYTTPKFESGEHELHARAVDFAGNYLEEKATFDIEPVESPEIISYPYLLQFGRIAIDCVTMITILVVLIISAIIVIFYSRYRLSFWRKRAKKE